MSTFPVNSPHDSSTVAWLVDYSLDFDSDTITARCLLATSADFDEARRFIREEIEPKVIRPGDPIRSYQRLRISAALQQLDELARRLANVSDTPIINPEDMPGWKGRPLG